MRSGKGGSSLLARQRPPPTRVGGSHGAVRASGYAARGRRLSTPTSARSPARRSPTSGTCSRGTASNQATGIDQGGDRVPGEPRPQVIGPGHDHGLAWLIVWVRPERALRPSAISARIASTAPSRPFGAPRAPAGLSGPGGTGRIQRVRFPLTAAVLAV